MKNTSGCRNKKYTFDSAQQAKAFACGLGIEREFLFNPSFPEIESPVVLYVFRRPEYLVAVVIFYEITREIGLWVHPDLRGQRLGSLVFREVVGAMENNHGRIFAFLDGINSGNTKAMSKILLRSGFSPISSQVTSERSLWVRSFPE